jgi:deazaflavin-dependent oxidoreductase (nitroreductase family)
MTERHLAPAASRRAKPTGLARWILKLPNLLYRWHLGWLLGRRFLLLTHRGRKSGLTRRTVLEVVRYDPATRESVVLSGLGTVADWYRNIEAQPASAVQTGWGVYTPQQRFLTPEEAGEVADDFARHHPIEVRLGRSVLAWLGWADGDARATWRAMATAVPMVAFRPGEHPGGHEDAAGRGE